MALAAVFHVACNRWRRRRSPSFWPFAEPRSVFLCSWVLAVVTSLDSSTNTSTSPPNGAAKEEKESSLSLEEKAKVINAVASGRKKCDVATEHGIPASTLSTILKGKDAILRATSSGKATKKKNLKTTLYEKLEEALYTWFMDARAKNAMKAAAIIAKNITGSEEAVPAQHQDEIMVRRAVRQRERAAARGLAPRHGMVPRIQTVPVDGPVPTDPDGLRRFDQRDIAVLGKVRLASDRGVPGSQHPALDGGFDRLRVALPHLADRPEAEAFTRLVAADINRAQAPADQLRHAPARLTREPELFAGLFPRELGLTGIEYRHPIHLHLDQMYVAFVAYQLEHRGPTRWDFGRRSRPSTSMAATAGSAVAPLQQAFPPAQGRYLCPRPRRGPGRLAPQQPTGLSPPNRPPSGESAPGGESMVSRLRPRRQINYCEQVSRRARTVSLPPAAPERQSPTSPSSHTSSPPDSPCITDSGGRSTEPRRERLLESMPANRGLAGAKNHVMTQKQKLRKEQQMIENRRIDLEKGQISLERERQMTDGKLAHRKLIMKEEDRLHQRQLINQQAEMIGKMVDQTVETNQLLHQFLSETSD
ncbi:hypothetical protein HPB47_024196 [Ixodes persulcatus]|uniref:Uncharacterized protein n=1 Tax=Ixodes persulcatus TaxID=34615 RepID=A0AC60Q4Y4_IXOPE|nr:hypothetical protein HPB47_024196 [Ixodes persulcatus]